MVARFLNSLAEDMAPRRSMSSVTSAGKAHGGSRLPELPRRRRPDPHGSEPAARSASGRRRYRPDPAEPDFAGAQGREQTGPPGRQPISPGASHIAPRPEVPGAAVRARPRSKGHSVAQSDLVDRREGLAAFMEDDVDLEFVEGPPDAVAKSR